ncbi:hypothetical protein BU16DRAFT_615326 [Lophium mytilinum]|uniref:Uncharacterized protein n=1 Tax=Lophium mytilinum TaxID=390894 RepID=A0A6A6R3B4_9PEZI|nr:hypothetical protein BU16DRAFT_615326 [Lophium mytilinum]
MDAECLTAMASKLAVHRHRAERFTMHEKSPLAPPCVLDLFDIAASSEASIGAGPGGLPRPVHAVQQAPPYAVRAATGHGSRSSTSPEEPRDAQTASPARTASPTRLQRPAPSSPRREAFTADRTECVDECLRQRSGGDGWGNLSLEHANPAKALQMGVGA